MTWIGEIRPTLLKNGMASKEIVYIFFFLS